MAAQCFSFDFFENNNHQHILTHKGRQNAQVAVFDKFRLIILSYERAKIIIANRKNSALQVLVLRQVELILTNPKVRQKVAAGFSSSRITVT